MISLKFKKEEQEINITADSIQDGLFKVLDHIGWKMTIPNQYEFIKRINSSLRNLKMVRDDFDNEAYHIYKITNNLKYYICTIHENNLEYILSKEIIDTLNNEYNEVDFRFFSELIEDNNN